MELNKNKIAVLCNYVLLPNRVGGMDYFFWKFDEEVKKLGYEIHWFFPESEIHQKYKEFTIFFANKSIEDTFLENLNNSKRYDFVFTHFLELCTPFYLKIKKDLPKVKIIVVDHNPRPINGYSIKKKIIKKLKGFFYSKYIDLFIGVSKYTKNEIIKDFGIHLKSKTEIIYNGILIEKIKVRVERNTQKPTFLTACHLRYSKGLQDLIMAVSLLSESNKQNIIIDVYGDGYYKKELVSLIQKLGLEKIFIFKGNSSSLGDVFCGYDYLIQPSHEETFCYSIVESYCANVPAITTCLPGGNVLGIIKDNHNGFIFPPKDSNLLKNILEDIILGKRKIEGNVSNEIRQQFTLEKMVLDYLKLIK